MDIFCYGFLREAIIYIMTMVIAVAPAFLAAKVFEWRRVRLGINTPPRRDLIRFTDFLVFLIFMAGFFAGIYVSHSFMRESCGFSPNIKAYEDEKRLDDIQYKIDILESERAYEIERQQRNR